MASNPFLVFGEGPARVLLVGNCAGLAVDRDCTEHLVGAGAEARAQKGDGDVVEDLEVAVFLDVIRVRLVACGLDGGANKVAGLRVLHRQTTAVEATGDKPNTNDFE